MPDDRIVIHLDRGERWTAFAHAADPRGAGLLQSSRITRVADGPAAALEAVGQELDRREAQRLTREARGETGPVTVEEAVERALQRDVARVVEALEAAHDEDPVLALDPLHVANRCGFVREAVERRNLGPADIEVRAEAEGRARRALARAEADGVAARRSEGLELWALQHLDEIEPTR